MAEPSLKRQRNEEDEENDLTPPPDAKRHKSYDDIFSILEEDEDLPADDLSSLITSFEREIASPESAINGASSFSETHSSEEDDACGEVMRRLLEASDDELGLPTSAAPPEASAGDSPEVFAGDGLWEIEDEAANYYTLLQSELFMHVGEI